MRLSSPTHSIILYPNECQLCGKIRVQHNGKKTVPLTIKTKVAETTIKNISKERNLDLYGKIKDDDLLAKEFRYHSHCYKDFTRQWTNQTKGVYEKGNFDVVTDFIVKEIIGGRIYILINEATKIC